MKLPRDLSSDELVKALARLGYEVNRQAGSHIRLTTQRDGEHHVTIPRPQTAQNWYPQCYLAGRCRPCQFKSRSVAGNIVFIGTTADHNVLRQKARSHLEDSESDRASALKIQLKEIAIQQITYESRN